MKSIYYKGTTTNQQVKEKFSRQPGKTLKKKIRLDPYRTPYTMMESRWIKTLNKKGKTTKLVEGNTGNNIAT